MHGRNRHLKIQSHRLAVLEKVKKPARQSLSPASVTPSHKSSRRLPPSAFASSAQVRAPRRFSETSSGPSRTFQTGTLKATRIRTRDALPSRHHIWLWATLEPHKLTSEVHQILNESESDLHLSPISLWELAVLIEEKKFALQEDFAIWVQRSVVDLELSEVPLNWRVVHEMRYILPNHKDPADRFLAATAIAFNLILVTADQRLIGVPGLNVLANV